LARVLQARALAAAEASYGVPTGGARYAGGGFTPHGGDWGFFPAPGTNYSVGDEPQIAARLDALGKALQLHLIGLSGYRTPRHSVEVGGFADDPHTRGEASDTPGVEGVPEATLLKFGLTRPFPGAAEADHIQLA
jgi:Peptidase M15